MDLLNSKFVLFTPNLAKKKSFLSLCECVFYFIIYLLISVESVLWIKRFRLCQTVTYLFCILSCVFILFSNVTAAIQYSCKNEKKNIVLLIQDNNFFFSWKYVANWINLFVLFRESLWKKWVNYLRCARTERTNNTTVLNCCQKRDH